MRLSIYFCIALCGLVINGTAFSASLDEIQVYDNAINEAGKFGLDVHSNYVIDGAKTPAWSGDAPSNHSLRVTPELSYGLSEKWELGAYLPLLKTSNGPGYVEGAKLRIKYMSAPKDETFYWGINQEFGRVSIRSDEDNWNYDLRPILGYFVGKWHLTLNPILAWDVSGTNSRVPDFSPAFRIKYELNGGLGVGLEHYAVLGKINNILPYAQQTHNTYVILDSEIAGHPVDFGIGKGWNANSDKWTAKAVVSSTFQ